MRFISTAIFLMISLSVFSQHSKPPLTHDVYDSWKDLDNYKISRDGSTILYEIDPQKGDGYLFWYMTGHRTYDSIARGADGKFSPSGDLIVCRIEFPHDSVRKMLLGGKKKKDLPKDSLAVIDLQKDTVMKFAEVFKFDVSEENEDIIAFLLRHQNESTPADSLKARKKGKKEDKKDLYVIAPYLETYFRAENVEEYFISPQGKSVAYIQAVGDSVDSCAVRVFTPASGKLETLVATQGYATNISSDHKGEKIAFHYSTDTAETKVWSLQILEGRSWRETTTIDTTRQEIPGGWSVSHHMKPVFSDDGSRLYFGTAHLPEPEPKDTLTTEEMVSVDIWNWKDAKLQPQQKKEAEKEKKRTWLALWHFENDKMVQLATEEVEEIRPPLKENGRYVLGYSFRPYWKQTSWKTTRGRDVFLVDQQTGKKEKVLEDIRSTSDLSPGQDHIAWYNIADSSWYIYNVETGENKNITGSSDHVFYNEEHDMPSEAGHYGSAGWTSGGLFMIYDRYDLYLADPGKGTLTNMTEGFGRVNKLQLRRVDLDREDPLADLSRPQMLRAFNDVTKAAGFYKFSRGEGLEELLMEDARFSNPVKAEEAEGIIWTKETFLEYPNLWTSNLEMDSAVKITDVNPQSSEYRWGTVELVNWLSMNGDSLTGLLYQPENIDTTKKYPMLVYFYEKYSDRLHSHHVPKPSRSVINFTYYTSNGYFIFVPDIIYRTGHPGQSCYDAVMPGTMEMLKQSRIDEERLGLQGQSWGGYQVAWLVTRTDLFAAAMAGAPVSNMTSAYGGIRWGSGMSRMFQYEESQSRIGATLWEAPLLYLENSPVFRADKINTPLLIMHNDEDGAVPWYQGIELFTAMRRLNKPCWMLTYNKAPHNLSRRADMEDLTVRMQQFFDHFLKEEPAPVWMTEGIPAKKKGKESGLEIPHTHTQTQTQTNSRRVRDSNPRTR